MSSNPNVDNMIDDVVNPVLSKLDQMPDEEFRAYCQAHVSLLTRKAIKMMAAEQALVEGDPGRKEKLERLQRLL